MKIAISRKEEASKMAYEEKKKRRREYMPQENELENIKPSMKRNNISNNIEC